MAKKRLRVLVVDDDRAVRESLKFALELEGLEVVTHACGADLLRDVPVGDCLILDYKMPDMDGLAVMDALARRQQRIPTILITAPVTARIADDARRAGVYTVLEKPLTDDVLMDHIRGATIA